MSSSQEHIHNNLIHHIGALHMPQCNHMGWLRLVGSIKLQVSFTEYSLFYRSLLQKRPVTLSILLIESHPISYITALSYIISERNIRTLHIRAVYMSQRSHKSHQSIILLSYIISQCHVKQYACHTALMCPLMSHIRASQRSHISYESAFVSSCSHMICTMRHVITRSLHTIKRLVGSLK